MARLTKLSRLALFLFIQRCAARRIESSAASKRALAALRNTQILPSDGALSIDGNGTLEQSFGRPRVRSAQLAIAQFDHRIVVVRIDGKSVFELATPPNPAGPAHAMPSPIRDARSATPECSAIALRSRALGIHNPSNAKVRSPQLRFERRTVEPVALGAEVSVERLIEAAPLEQYRAAVEQQMRRHRLAPARRRARNLRECSSGRSPGSTDCLAFGRASSGGPRSRQAPCTASSADVGRRDRLPRERRAAPMPFGQQTGHRRGD